MGPSLHRRGDRQDDLEVKLHIPRNPREIVTRNQEEDCQLLRQGHQLVHQGTLPRFCEHGSLADNSSHVRDFRLSTHHIQQTARDAYYEETRVQVGLPQEYRGDLRGDHP